MCFVVEVDFSLVCLLDQYDDKITINFNLPLPLVYTNLFNSLHMHQNTLRSWPTVHKLLLLECIPRRLYILFPFNSNRIWDSTSTWFKSWDWKTQYQVHVWLTFRFTCIKTDNREKGHSLGVFVVQPSHGISIVNEERTKDLLVNFPYLDNLLI